MEFIINNVFDMFGFITDFLLKQTIYTLILFVIIFIAAFLLRKKSPLWHLGLWLLVLIRLILPTDLSLPISARGLAEKIPLVNNVPVSIDGIVDKVEESAYHDFEKPSNNEAIVKEDNANIIKTSFNQISDKFISWPILFAIAWLTGCVLLTLFFANRLLRFHRIVKHSSLIQDKKLMDFLISWQSRLKIRRKVSIISSDEFISPFTIGLFRPNIFIPQLLLKIANKETIHSIIAHEMVHIKRFDALWIKVQNILQIVYFFNPAVWYASRKINLAREQICDSTVLTGRVISPKSYGNGMLQVLKLNLFGFDLADPLPGFGGHKKFFKYRIENIKKENAMKKQKTMFVFITICFIGIFMLPLASSNYSVNAMNIDAKAIDSKVDEYMNELVKQKSFSGSILIAKDGKPVVMRSYGFANIAERIPNTPQTKFRIAELTMQFTAAAIMKLQEQGKLNVQDLICKYLDDCPNAWKSITIHHLLSHTSGIPNYMLLPNFSQMISQKMSPQQVADLFKNRVMIFIPGTGTSYSNSGYHLLGMIIEKISGMSYKDFMQNNIFKPLGMKNTGVECHDDVIENLSIGYDRRDDEIVKARFINMSIPYSAGSMYSTVEDLLIWDQALYSEKVLSNKSLETIFSQYKCRGFGYYGWYIDHSFNRKKVLHTGGTFGFFSTIICFPEEKICMIILSNLRTIYGEFIPGESRYIEKDLATITFGEKYKLLRGHKIANIDTTVYDKYVGEYKLYPMAIITIVRKDGILFSRITNDRKFEYVPELEAVFFHSSDTEGEPGLGLEFIKDANGSVNQLIFRIDYSFYIREMQLRKIK